METPFLSKANKEGTWMAERRGKGSNWILFGTHELGDRISLFARTRGYGTYGTELFCQKRSIRNKTWPQWTSKLAVMKSGLNKENTQLLPRFCNNYGTTDSTTAVLLEKIQ